MEQDRDSMPTWQRHDRMHAHITEKHVNFNKN